MQCFCRNDEVAKHLGLKSGRGKKRKDKNKRRSVQHCCCKPNKLLVVLNPSYWLAGQARAKAAGQKPFLKQSIASLERPHYTMHLAGRNNTPLQHSLTCHTQSRNDAQSEGTNHKRRSFLDQHSIMLDSSSAGPLHMLKLLYTGCTEGICDSRWF